MKYGIAARRRTWCPTLAGSNKALTSVAVIVSCGMFGCSSAWKPCFSACKSPLSPAFEVDRSVQPVVIELAPTAMWKDSGIAVRKGDRLLFTATGEIAWNARGPSVGPDGVDGRPGWRVGRGGLVGKVGADGKPFDIGARTGLFPARHARPPYHHSPPPPIRMPRDGRLFVGFKDFTGGAHTGTLRVAIHAARSTNARTHT